MSHLLRPNGDDDKSRTSLCEICGFNTWSYRIHDKFNIEWRHHSSKDMKVPNKDLKIGRGATQSTGALAQVGVAGGRMAYKGKIGKKTGGGLQVAGGVFSLADGIMGIIDTATTEIELERCESCNRTPNTRGCKAVCSTCGVECENNDWKKAKKGQPCCYQICKECFGNLRD